MGLSSENGYAMLEDNTFSDFKITCQDKEFHVHRNILSQAGDFFKVAVGKGFKEGVSGICDFPEEQPTIVARALVFVYGGKYSDDPSVDHSTIWHPSLNPAFEDSATLQPESSLDISFLTHSFADKCGLNGLKDAVYNQFMSRAVEHFATNEFSDILKKIYENTSRDAEGLRLAVTRLCITKHMIMKEKPELLEVIQLNEPMAFRCGMLSIKDEDLGECYKYTWPLEKLERRLQQLIRSIDNRNACGGCGAQFAIKLKIQESDCYELTCSDCGLGWQWIS